MSLEEPSGLVSTLVPTTTLPPEEGRISWQSQQTVPSALS